MNFEEGGRRMGANGGRRIPSGCVRAYPLPFFPPPPPSLLHLPPEGRFNYNNHNVTVPGILPKAPQRLVSHRRKANRFPKSRTVFRIAPRCYFFITAYRVCVCVCVIFFFFISLPRKKYRVSLSERVCSQSDSDL